MKMKIKTKIDIDVKFLKLDAGVRYFEDAKVNGVQDDEDNPQIPFAVFCKTEKGFWCDMYRWQPTIDLEEGKIVDWPKGTIACIHYKVCDDGTYSLLDKDKNVLMEVNSYVPDILCPKEEGYGDYIIMNVDGDGYISGWKCNQRLIDNLIRGAFNYEED